MKKLILPLLLCCSLAVFAQNGALTVIGNSNGVPSSFTKAGLKSVFMGNTANWPNGTKVKLALMKFTTTEGQQTCSKLFGMSSGDVTKHWLMTSMKGKVDAPVFFTSADALQQFVARTPGAIGIVAGAVTLKNSKTVLVNGRNSF